MNDQPLVSVLVPCYNVERYVGQCLESLATQTLADAEFICINDGSTDSTPEIIARFAEEDPRFRVITKENSGYGASMNLALDQARGTYIGILESDDFCEPNTFERLIGIAKSMDAQVVKANFWYYQSTGEPVNELKELVKPTDPTVVSPRSFHEVFWYPPSIWSALYRRDYLNANGIRFLETPGASYQDTSFAFKVWANASRVALCRDAFVHYRQDNEASSVKSKGKAFIICEEFKEIERFLHSRPELAALKPVEVRLKFDSYLWNYLRLEGKVRVDFLVRFFEEFGLEEARGTIDYDLFPSWTEIDLRHLLKDPESFYKWTEATGGKQAKNKVAALARYVGVGGPKLLRKRLSERE